MPDHMNYYRGDMDRYFRDKAAIARFQKPGDFFITTPEIKKRAEATFGPLQATCITATSLPDDWTLALPGEHNRQNAGYAVAAARILGISDEIMKKVLKDFSGLPGRLEFLGEKNGVTFYDDANSTTPEAGIAALRALAPLGRPIILIAGGSDKELEFGAFAREIEKSAKKVVLFRGKATEKFWRFCRKNSGPRSRQTWMKRFRSHSKRLKGETLLFSLPARQVSAFSKTNMIAATSSGSALKR